jgi:hypothetical protein
MDSAAGLEDLRGLGRRVAGQDDRQVPQRGFDPLGQALPERIRRPAHISEFETRPAPVVPGRRLIARDLHRVPTRFVGMGEFAPDAQQVAAGKQHPPGPAAERQGSAVAGQGRIRLSGAGQGFAEQLVHDGVLGQVVNALRQQLRGFLRLIDSQQCACQTRHRVGGLRVPPQHLTELRHRLLGAIQIQQALPVAHSEDGVLGIEPQPLGEDRRRLLEALLAGECVPQSQTDPEVVGLSLQGSSQRLLRHSSLLPRARGRVLALLC